jgi:hypothetical protein
MKSIVIIETDILKNINVEKSYWKIINKRKSQQIYSKEIIFQKSFNIKEEDFKLFKDYLEEYKSFKHSLNPLKYVIFPNIEQMKNGSLCTEFQNDNLKNKIKKLSNNEERLNDVLKFIIIYGIAKFMEFLELKNKYHGRLYISNIFLESNFRPIITDPLIHHIFKNYEEDKKNYLLRAFYVIQEYILKKIL